MQPHSWCYSIINIIQSEDLMQVFSLHCSIKNCQLNWVNIAIDGVRKYGDMSETTRCPNFY